MITGHVSDPVIRHSVQHQARRFRNPEPSISSCSGNHPFGVVDTLVCSVEFRRLAYELSGAFHLCREGANSSSQACQTSRRPLSVRFPRHARLVIQNPQEISAKSVRYYFGDGSRRSGLQCLLECPQVGPPILLSCVDTTRIDWPQSAPGLDLHWSGSPHPPIPGHYPSGFSDSFAESTIGPSRCLSESPFIDPAVDYLHFHKPPHYYTLMDSDSKRSSVNVDAQLCGIFLLVEPRLASPPGASPPPPELVCYRRSLFQITGSVTLAREPKYAFAEDGSRTHIHELGIAVSATESMGNDPVKIISVPRKTLAGGEVAQPEDKVEQEPPTISLDRIPGQE